jgi:transposase
MRQMHRQSLTAYAQPLCETVVECPSPRGSEVLVRIERCAGYGIRHGRCHHRQSPSPRSGRKRGTQNQAIGRSKGGMTTKILALTDALGNLVRFVLLPGHRFDTVGVAPLIDGIAFGGLIADKAFDSNAIIANLNERGAKIVISQHPRRALPLRLDTELYKWRHLIENFFCKLKEFKRIAMRADKTDQSFAAIIHLAAAVINSR